MKCPECGSKDVKVVGNKRWRCQSIDKDQSTIVLKVLNCCARGVVMLGGDLAVTHSRIKPPHLHSPAEHEAIRQRRIVRQMREHAVLLERLAET